VVDRGPGGPVATAVGPCRALASACWCPALVRRHARGGRASCSGTAFFGLSTTCQRFSRVRQTTPAALREYFLAGDGWWPACFHPPAWSGLARGLRTERGKGTPGEEGWQRGAGLLSAFIAQLRRCLASGRYAGVSSPLAATKIASYFGCRATRLRPVDSPTGQDSAGGRFVRRAPVCGLPVGTHPLAHLHPGCWALDVSAMGAP